MVVLSVHTDQRYHILVKALALKSLNYVAGMRGKQILAGCKVVDSINWVNVDHHGMSMSKIIMYQYVVYRKFQ